MTTRREFFRQLRALINSAERNYEHGRRHIGDRKLMRAYRLLGGWGAPQTQQESKEAEG